MKRKKRKKLSVYIRDFWDNPNINEHFEHKDFVNEKKLKNKKYNFYNYMRLRGIKLMKRKNIDKIQQMLKDEPELFVEIVMLYNNELIKGLKKAITKKNLLKLIKEHKFDKM